MKGRKPTTIVAGNVADIPRPPTWLSKEAKAEWKRIMPELVDRRILTPADMGMVETYVTTIGNFRALEREMRASGLIDPKLLRLQNQAAQTARQIAAEIGLTPVSRSRPSVREDDDDEADELGLN